MNLSFQNFQNFGFRNMDRQQSSTFLLNFQVYNQFQNRFNYKNNNDLFIHEKTYNKHY